MWFIRSFSFAIFVCVSSLLSQASVTGDRRKCEAEDLPARLVSCTRLIETGKLRGEELANAYNHRGMGYVMLGDVDRALADFNSAISLHPELETVYLNRGYAHVFKQDRVRAQADFELAMSVRPDWAPPFVGRAVLHYMNGSIQKAISDLTKAISLDPYDAQVYLNRGVLYRETGKISRATKDFNRAISLDPFNEAARQQLKELFAKPDIEHRLPPGRIGILIKGQNLAVGHGRNSAQCSTVQKKVSQNKYSCQFARTSN